MPNYNVRLRKKSGNGWDTLYPESLASLIKTNGGSDVQVFMDTVYDKGATPNANGAMTKEDKRKLDGIEERANRYVHPNNPSTRHVSDAQIDIWNDKYTKIEVDNLFNQLIIGLDWKESVNTFNDIAINYPNPQDGWTVNTKDTDITYRYDGTGWIAISANAIPLVSHTVDGKMSSTDKIKLDNLGPRVDGLANDLANLNQGIAGDLTAVINRINNVEQTVNGYNNQIAALENDKADKNHHHDNRYSQLNHDHDTRYAAINHTHNYLPLTGGTMTGSIQMNGQPLRLTTNHNNNARIGYDNNTTDVYIANINNELFRLKSDKTITYAGYKVYSSFDKPTPAEIGAAEINHNQGSNTINAMTGYTKGNIGGAITQTDSLNVAINKLEVNLDGKAASNHTHPYLPLTGGNLTGDVNTTNSINFTSISGGIKHKGGVILRNNDVSTVLSAINGTIFFRPQGDTTQTNQATLDINGNFTANRFVGNLQGNAATATRLQNARTIQLTGAITGQANFDGSANIQINTTLVNPPKGRLVRLRNRVAVNTTTKTVNIGIGAFNVNNDILNVYLAGVRLEPTIEYTNTQSQITLTGTNNFVNGDVVSFEVIQMQ